MFIWFPSCIIAQSKKAKSFVLHVCLERLSVSQNVSDLHLLTCLNMSRALCWRWRAACEHLLISSKHKVQQRLMGMLLVLQLVYHPPKLQFSLKSEQKYHNSHPDSCGGFSVRITLGARLNWPTATNIFGVWPTVSESLWVNVFSFSQRTQCQQFTGFNLF